MTFCEIIPSHEVASWLMSHIYNLFAAIGLEHSRSLEQIAYVVVIIAVGVTLGWTIRTIILLIARQFVKLRDNDFARKLLREKVLLRCSRFITPSVILGLIPWAFNEGSSLLAITQKIVTVWLLYAIALGINSVLTFIWMRYDERMNTRNLPLRGILDTCKGIVWAIMVIIGVSLLVGKSPGSLLAGLGAFAAALMLIFKDSILGLVASVQLSQNDMIHVGDWVVVPSTPANGIVLDITLTTVKVQNFDNTIITLPPYTLVSSSFQNWRGMKDSGCRRIARNVIIESTSVKTLDQAAIKDIVDKVPSLAQFVSKSNATPVYDPGVATVNGTIDTNLGLFRAYMCDYILHNPAFNHDAQILVRTMDPTAVGIPLQIYCFAATTAWTAYEAIQSALFEHVFTMAPLFGLTVFNYSSSSDAELIKVDDGTPKAAEQA